MSDTPAQQGSNGSFDQLIQSGGEHTYFTVGFRGYDRQEVDTALADLQGKLQRATADLAAAAERRDADVEAARAEERVEADKAKADADKVKAEAEKAKAASAKADADREKATAKLKADLAVRHYGARTPRG